MKKSLRYLLGRLIAGALVIVPPYLCILLLIKASGSITQLIKPIAIFMPGEGKAAGLIAILLVIALCIAVGIIMQTMIGRSLEEKIEQRVFARIPGYNLLRSMSQQALGESHDHTWKPAFAEIEEALVPAFIIEEFEDGRYTVFVPSVPTPLAGAVYILEPERVHPLDVPFHRAIQMVSRWGTGARDVLLAHETSKGRLDPQGKFTKEDMPARY